MKRSMPILLALLLTCGSGARATDFEDTCAASSSYDLVVGADALVFERGAPAPRRVEWRDGRLRVDGVVVRLNTEDADRLGLFARELRALVPKVKAIALRGLDLATGVVRTETRRLATSADTRAEVDRRIAAHAAELRARIAASTSTREWQAEAFERDVAGWSADLAPLLVADVGRGAITAALDGDLDEAVALQARASELGNGLQPKIERRLRDLRPQVEALCPSIRRLHELQDGVRDGDGRPLDLLDIGAARH
ncbi:MAG: DUF2884 family protein [Dokdonella sp.]|uniref:DUF2884 family protein n=1 Tax=Dokdonella sp. TaxID=2291710 RepID=UPI003F80360A